MNPGNLVVRANSQGVKHMVFKIAEEQYAFDLLRIREVLAAVEVTRVPGTPNFVRGIINVRGSVVPVVDLRQKFAMGTTELLEHSVILLVDHNANGTLIRLGVIVDDVIDIASVSAECVEPPPNYGSTLFSNDYILGIFRSNDGMVFLLDADRILRADESRALSAIVLGVLRVIVVMSVLRASSSLLPPAVVKTASTTRTASTSLGTFQIDTDVFKSFCKLAYDHAGIRLADGKETFVIARIAKRIAALELSGPRAYLDHLKKSKDSEIDHFIDAIATNFTSFFREPGHFLRLETWCREAVHQGHRTLRIWSAACSTGEEAFTVAMVLEHALNGERAEVRVLGTDISTRALKTARAATYTSQQIAAVPLKYRLYFEPIESTGNGSRFRVVPSLCRRVVFERLNLIVPALRVAPTMHVVFCRNVLIYFDANTRQRLVRELERIVHPGGLLMIGHSESLTGLQTNFSLIEPSVYTKRFL